MRIPVIVVFAPTATGKTALALNLFGHSSHSFFKDKAELISADSIQAYRKLNIGTAKPTSTELLELPHHLINIRDYTEQYNVADFVESADFLCKKIWESGKIPLVAGGTGFYIRNFLLGLPRTPESDENLRNELKQKCKDFGKYYMYDELKKIDPISAKKININDEYRILRALEVFYLTGKPRSSFELTKNLRDKFNFITIILEKNRESLYQRINERVDMMFCQGLKEEVFSLIEEGAKKDMPGMQAIGYREWFCNDYNCSEGLLKIREEIKHSSRKYAKKQYTFMQGIPNANIISADNESKMINEVELLLMENLNK